MAKYYVCEGSTVEGVTQVTPVETDEDALDIASSSTAQVHFVSTINPLENDNRESENVQLQR
jgi:predicted RNA methylase